VLERARLEALAVRAVDVVDVEACDPVPVDARAGDALRLVGRVVEDLDLEEISRTSR
jgi:hypothetical protein